jgi:hypothetical protein
MAGGTAEVRGMAGIALVWSTDKEMATLVWEKDKDWRETRSVYCGSGPMGWWVLTCEPKKLIIIICIFYLLWKIFC